MSDKSIEIRQKIDAIINSKANSIEDIVFLSRLIYGYSLEIEVVGKNAGATERNYNLVRSQIGSSLSEEMPMGKAEIKAKSIAEEKYGHYRELIKQGQAMKGIIDSAKMFVSVSQQAIKLQMSTTDYLPTKD